MPTLARQIREVLSRCGKPIQDGPERLSRAGAIQRSIRHLCPFTPSLEAWKATAGLFASAGPMGIVDPRFLDMEAEEGHLYAVVGDLRGDYSAFEEILRSFFPPNLDDAEVRRRHLILVGDIQEPGARDFELLQAILELGVLLEDNLVLLRGHHDAPCVEDGHPWQEFLQALAGYLAWLPHLAILRAPSGTVAFCHAGIPPEHLQVQAEGAADYFEPEPIRKAFQEGRGPIPGPRPQEPYSHRTFYSEDFDRFCRRFDVQLLIRGHDPQPPKHASQPWGYPAEAEGRFLTLQASGCAQAPGATASEGVSATRFLVLDGVRLFRGLGQFAGLDAGISVEEVFRRDVVLVLASGSPAEGELMRGLADRIQEGLARVRDLPVHVVERPGYSLEADQTTPTRSIRSAPSPREPAPPTFQPRHAFEIARTFSGALGLKEVLPPGPHPQGRARRHVACREVADFAQKSVAFITETLDLQT